MTGGNLLANNTGDTNTVAGKGVDIKADTLTPKDSSRVSTNTLGNGKAGNITIAATGDMVVNDSTIRSAAVSNGNSGNITVSAKKPDYRPS